MAHLKKLFHSDRSVFEEVHENSKDVWKWEMYRLVSEYDKWPGLAPPFVILEDIFKFFKGIWKVTCRRKKEDCELTYSIYIEYGADGMNRF